MDVGWFQEQWNDIKGNLKFWVILLVGGTLVKVLTNGLQWWQQGGLILVFVVSCVSTFILARKTPKKAGPPSHVEIRFGPDAPYRFVESMHDTTHSRMGIYNPGPSTVDNLQVWLIRITPRPLSPLFPADFPYAVRWAHGENKDTVGYHLNSKSETHYEFLSWWVAASNQLYVDGIDTKHEPRDARFPIEDGESWRMDYEVTCIGAEPQRVSFLVRRIGQGIFVSHEN